MECWSVKGRPSHHCHPLGGAHPPAPKGGRNNSARLHFAAQALWAQHRVNHLVANVRDFPLTEPWRKGLYRLLDHSDLLPALSKTRERILSFISCGARD